MDDATKSRYLLKSKNPWADKAGYDAAAKAAQEYQQIIDFTDALLKEADRFSVTPQGSVVQTSNAKFPAAFRNVFVSDVLQDHKYVPDDLFIKYLEQATKAYPSLGEPTMNVAKAKSVGTEMRARQQVQKLAMALMEHGPKEYALPQPAVFGPYTQKSITPYPAPDPSPEGKLKELAKVSGKAALFLDLLTTSPALNQGEQQQLDAIYGARPAPKDQTAETVYQLIQNAVRQLSTPAR